MAPPLPPDQRYRDHPAAARMRLMGVVRIGFIVLTLVLAVVTAAYWEM